MKARCAAIFSFVPTLLSVLFFVRRHWHLVESLRTFPTLPDDWTDSEKVRIFVAALMRSNAADEMTKLTTTKWDDNLRLVLANLAENPVFWGIAWDVANRADNEDGSERLTLRERIKNRLFRTVGEEYTTQTQVDGMVELEDTIKGLLLLTKKN